MLNSRVDLSLEYYGATGVLTDPLPGSEQVHQFFPGADINLSPNVVWNVGVGFGTTAGSAKISTPFSPNFGFGCCWIMKLDTSRAPAFTPPPVIQIVNPAALC